MTTESQPTDASRDPSRDAFRAGYDAGNNAVSSGEFYDEERDAAYARFAKAPDPDEVKRQVADIELVMLARLADDRTERSAVIATLATLAYELGARVR